MAEFETTRDAAGNPVVVERRSNNMGWLVALLIVVALVVAAFAFGLIDIGQTKGAKLPEVSVSGGQAPAFDVNTAKVDLGTKETTVDVPTVGTKEETIKVPTMSVEKADKVDEKK